jgi:hypothetical protein
MRRWNGGLSGSAFLRSARGEGTGNTSTTPQTRFPARWGLGPGWREFQGKLTAGKRGSRFPCILGVGLHTQAVNFPPQGRVSMSFNFAHSALCFLSGPFRRGAGTPHLPAPGDHHVRSWSQRKQGPLGNDFPFRVSENRKEEESSNCTKPFRNPGLWVELKTTVSCLQNP